MIRFEQRRDFGEKINATFSFLTENLRGLGLALLYIVGPVALIGGIITGYIQAGVLGDASSVTTVDQMLNLYSRLLSGGALIGSGFQFIGLVFVSFVSYSYIRLYQGQKKRNISVGDIWVDMQPFIGPGLLLTLVSVFMVAIAFVFALIILRSILLTITALPIILLAFFVLMTPVAYLLVVLSLAPAILVFERVGAGKAITRSFKLIVGHWWSTFGLLLVMIIVMIIVSMIFAIPVGVVGGLLGAGVLKEVMVLSTLATAISSVGTALLQSLPVTAVAVQYFDLVEEKEGSSLGHAIDRIGQAPVSTDDDLSASARQATEEEGDY